MKKTFLFISLLFLSLGICQQTLAQERYQATWESLKKYNTPDWYRDAKFGIFIHWECILKKLSFRKCGCV